MSTAHSYLIMLWCGGFFVGVAVSMATLGSNGVGMPIVLGAAGCVFSERASSPRCDASPFQGKRHDQR